MEEDAAIDIPQDLRELRDFPVYDTTFMDGPKFRQQLLHWSMKTDKISASLTSLADAFELFHSSGLEQCQAATRMVECMTKISGYCTNSRGDTIAAPLQQFASSLQNIWCYYETFLEQTRQLNADPVRQLANNFSRLKKMHEDVMQCRKDYLEAAEALCDCRHVSKITDKSTFSTLAESCYTAQRCYQTALSDYVISLRQAHTEDMVTLVGRIIEHILSIYSYYNFSALMLKDLEPTVNALFTRTRDWKLYYENELRQWQLLHERIQKHLLADFQHNLGFTPALDSTSGGHTIWHADNTAQGRNMFKRIFPSSPIPVPMKRSASQSVQTSSAEWCVIDSSDLETVESNLDDDPSPALRRHSTTSKDIKGKPKSKGKKIKIQRTHSIPIDPDELPLKIHLLKPRKMVKSISDPDLVLSDQTRLAVPVDQKPSVSNGDVHHSLHTSIRAGESAPLGPKRSHTVDDIIVHPARSAPLRPLAAVFGKRSRIKDKAGKHSGKVSTSLDDLSTPEDGHAPQEGHTPQSYPAQLENTQSSTELSPRIGKKHKPNFIKRMRTSLSHNDNGGGHGSSSGRAGTGGRATRSRSSTPDDGAESPDSPSSLQRQSEILESLGSLEKLVPRSPTNWIKSGYLWLRMKLPNNRYAWTHIYCVVDRSLGQLMVQEQSLPEPRRLEDLLLCSAKACAPDFIDRNFCFRLISPTTEHLFQALSEHDMQEWMGALQEAVEEAIKNQDHGPKARKPSTLSSSHQPSTSQNGTETTYMSTAVATETILAVDGNDRCADCTSTEVEWASINLGIALCIACSGVHRGLGVHVSKVRSLSLDKWDKTTVEFMQSQGNSKSNSYYEALLGSRGRGQEMRRPPSNANKSERSQFIRLKYVSLAFVPEDDARSTHL